MTRLLILLISLSLIQTACSSLGCSSCQEDTAKAPEAATTVTTISNNKDADGLPKNNVSLDYKDMDARTILKQLFEDAQVKYEFSPSVQKNMMTMKIDNVPWREALNQITASAGYDYAVTDGVVQVKMAAVKKTKGKKKVKKS